MKNNNTNKQSANTRVRDILRVIFYVSFILKHIPLLVSGAAQPILQNIILLLIFTSAFGRVICWICDTAKAKKLRAV